MTNLFLAYWRFEPGDDRRLWFQVTASTVAWFLLGTADMFITWRACVHHEQFGGSSSHPGASALLFVSGFVFLGLSVLAGAMSYLGWRELSGRIDLLNAEGRERKEFMSQAGFFMSLMLGIGTVWMCLPLFILELCTRTR